MESSQLKRISIIGISILCLSPVEIFSKKLFENRKKNNTVEIANIAKLEPNYLANNYEIFNPNIKSVSENMQELTNENKKKENSDSENKLESDATVETEMLETKEEVVVENVEETSTSTTKKEVQETNVQKIEASIQKEITTETKEVEETTQIVAPSNTELATSLVNFAKQYEGYPYKSGGTDLNTGVDCSGFTMKVFEQFGYNLPHSSRNQASMGTYISIDAIDIGDLIFYGYNGSISHVAIYIGNGQIIHATTNNGGIKIANYQMMPIITARRILN